MITIDELRRSGTEPEFFQPIGVFQLKIDDHVRYHFYHPDWPAKGANEFHNHRYSFTSEILAGCLKQEIFSVVPDEDGDFQCMSVTCKKGSDVLDMHNVSLFPIGSQTFVAGSSYFTEAHTFHIVKPAGPTITRVKRNIAQMRERAEIILPRGSMWSCPFGGAGVHVGVCWEVIEECLKWQGMPPSVGKAGYHIADIPKGELGEPSKIVEEALELRDAHNQGSSIMSAVELSDLHGAITAYKNRYHPHLTFYEIEKMCQITERAFTNGRRK